MQYQPVFALLALAGPVLSLSGKATTTRYYDLSKGSCGCGPASGNTMFGWQNGGPGFYTAAGSQAIFDTSNKSWCGSACGQCFQLTSTGSAPCAGCGAGGEAGQSIVVMITNLCPHNGNEQWCPAVGGTNEYGYSYHFDILAQREVFGDNPVVDFQSVPCPGAAIADFQQCQCA